MEALAQHRDRHTGRYCHAKVARSPGESRADRAMRIAHDLAWRHWLGGSLEQHHDDLRLYLHERASNAEEREQLLNLWLNDPPFQAFIPDSAHECERQLLLQTLPGCLSAHSQPSTTFPKDIWPGFSGGT